MPRPHALRGNEGFPPGIFARVAENRPRKIPVPGFSDRAWIERFSLPLSRPWSRLATVPARTANAAVIDSRVLRPSRPLRGGRFRPSEVERERRDPVLAGQRIQDRLFQL